MKRSRRWRTSRRRNRKRRSNTGAEQEEEKKKGGGGQRGAGVELGAREVGGKKEADIEKGEEEDEEE